MKATLRKSINEEESWSSLIRRQSLEVILAAERLFLVTFSYCKGYAATTGGSVRSAAQKILSRIVAEWSNSYSLVFKAALHHFSTDPYVPLHMLSQGWYGYASSICRGHRPLWG
jgi:hypothetical protein